MKFVPNAVSTLVARTALKSSQASPQVLFAAGIVGMGATVVLACRATLKVEDVLDNHEKALVAVEEAASTGATDVNRTKARIHLSTVGSLTKLYAPAVIVGALSVSALAGSHNILCKRNASLMAAYGTLQKAMEGYRQRVRDAYGEKREEELYLDVQQCEIEDEETGKVVKKKVANGGAPYMFLFDEHNRNFERIPEYNFLFLKMQQAWANQRLQARGHLFLNEVLECLGFEHTPAGAVTGWIRDGGDGYVDFGIFNRENDEKVVDFMVGRENAIWLNFNVDGVIYKQI